MLGSLLFIINIGQALAFFFVFKGISGYKVSFPFFLMLLVIVATNPYLLGYFGFIPLSLFFIVSSIFKNKEENKKLIWFYSIYTTLVTSLLGYLFTEIVSYLLKYTIETNQSEMLIINLVAPFFPVIANYTLLTLLKPNFIFFRKNSELINHVFFTTINIVLTICCILQYTNYWIEQYFGTNPVQNYLALIFIGTIIALLGYLSFKIRELNNQQIQQLKDEQVNDLATYVHHIEDLYSDIRSFRHDYQNVLISLKESINTKDVGVIEETYQTILANEKINLQDDKFHLTKLNNLKLLPIKGIVSAKVIKALQEQINVSIEITEPITETSLDVLDYVRILSILLDNAIEGAVQTEQPMLSIAFFFNEEQTEQTIIIENTCEEAKMNIKKLFEMGYSTKGSNRGIGLATLKSIFDQYEQLTLETECDQYLFRQVITIKGGCSHEYFHLRR